MTRAPRISKKQYQALLASFVADTTATQAVKQMIIRGEKKVSRPCATRYFRRWREVIRDHQLARYPRFSGEVEIDLGFFGGRAAKWTSAYVRRLAGLPAGRIVAKRKEIHKYARKKQPVLAILNRGGDIFVLPIKSKSRAHLEGAIRMIVEKGSVIFSDMEKGLDNLKLDGYLHRQVNHSQNHVDPQGYHINGVENFWREARRGMGKNFRGIPRSTIDMHIKEREYRYNHRHDLLEHFKALLTADRPSSAAGRRQGQRRRQTSTYKKSPSPPSRIRRTRRTRSARASLRA